MTVFAYHHLAPHGNAHLVPVPEVSSDWAPDTLSGGMPADRSARLAARRAFVALKLSFLYVVEGLDGEEALKSSVRRAEEPEDLWALRAPVFAALSGDDDMHRSRRQLLNRSLESMFSAFQPSMN